MTMNRRDAVEKRMVMMGGRWSVRRLFEQVALPEPNRKSKLSSWGYCFFGWIREQNPETGYTLGRKQTDWGLMVMMVLILYDAEQQRLLSMVWIWSERILNQPKVLTLLKLHKRSISLSKWHEWAIQKLAREKKLKVVNMLRDLPFWVYFTSEIGAGPSLELLEGSWQLIHVSLERVW